MADTLMLNGAVKRGPASMAGHMTEDRAAEDAQAVRAVLRGEVSVYGELYDRYVRLIHAVCRDACRDPSHAQDLVHDAFLRAFQRLSQLRRPERFGQWLLQIARSVCRDWLRKRVREPHRSVHIELALADVPAEDPNRRLAVLDRALARLPERERLAIHLAYLEEQPAASARQLLGLSQSGYYRVLDRARTRLERMISQEEGGNR